jgi:hypothetical protein
MHNHGNIFDGLVTNKLTYTELFRNLCGYRFFRDVCTRFERASVSTSCRSRPEDR